jgi:hypothetical protein
VSAARAARLALLALAVAALAAGIAGGLARLGVSFTLLPGAAALHGALMVSGFLGTVVSLERAIAVRSRLAFVAPLAAGLGSIALLAGWHLVAAALGVAAPLGLLAASVIIVRRQPQTHTVLLAIAAAAWGAGNVLFFLGLLQAALPWWFAFLILTIAAERLEMTRLTRRPPAAQALFLTITAALLVSCVLAIFHDGAGRVAFGGTLVALAAWLAAFDIARRTVRLPGLPRFAAVALLAGYAWLAVGGLAWAVAPAMRDLALHALALGFVFSMIFAHAPIIVPVVAGTPVRFTRFFYVPLALLHGSLAFRVTAGAGDAAFRLWGGTLNAAAILLFASTLIWATGRRRRIDGDQSAAAKGA